MSRGSKRDTYSGVRACLTDTRLRLGAENVVRALMGFASPSHRTEAQGDAHGVSPESALVEPWQADSPHSLAPELREWHAPLPRPDPAFSEVSNSVRTTPLGVQWRPQQFEIARPEAIMESVRRNLSRVPRWHSLFVAGPVADGGEMSIEHEAALLEAALVKASLAREPQPVERARRGH